ncbi:helix-turn-helix domain-containing protein [Dokdonella soli]|uniref:Helix-turn-helix domain-containing protein n=1 Tax=Dokdonella soli TaxID=529810 RepID=A0ABN1IJC4_9GAMM
MSKNIEHRLAYTIEGACEATGLTRTRIYCAIADGSLKTFKAGRRRMVSAKALEAFIAALEQGERRAAA